MNNPPNHPLYNPLGNPPNIHLLDSMFGMQAATDQHKQAGIIPAAQYAYQEQLQLQAAGQHHAAAMNLAQPHIVTTASEQPAQVLVYPGLAAAHHHHQQQQQQQQQPISYKIPQMQHVTAPSVVVPTPPAPQVHLQHTLHHQVDQRKKDIMAEAASKIFEDPVKKTAPIPVHQSAAPTANPLPTAIKSEPVAGPSSGPGPSGLGASMIKKEPGTGGPIAGPSTSMGMGRGRGRGNIIMPQNRGVSTRGGYGAVGRGRGQHQAVVPRISLLEDEDDGLTCRMCLQSFWYKKQLLEHLKDMHSITDPTRYEKEEREKKLRRQREDQHRGAAARRRMAMNQRARGRGRPPVGRPGPPMRDAGPKPSFQYRDGAFICDLCKKSFSDGNDMVTHWKSHVKQHRKDNPEATSYSEMRVPGKRGPGRPPGYRPSIHGRGRGAGGGRGRGTGLGRADKGKPRWTAYLVWSTRRRKELTRDNPDWSFAEVAKEISHEWKEVCPEDRETYQEEAEDMNEQGIRKLPTSRPPSSDSSSDDSDEDSEDWSESSDFDERNPGINIKKEEGSAAERIARQRKRPSFFQEFENEENNLDKILDDFELQQIEESKKPKEKKPIVPKDPNSRRGRRRKRTPSPEQPQEPVELETSRSGRIRKKIRFYDIANSGEEDIASGDDRGSNDEEFKPESDAEADEPEEEFVEDADPVEEELASDADDTLAPKKRTTLMTDEEIEAATKRAMDAKLGNLIKKEKEGESSSSTPTPSTNDATDKSQEEQQAGTSNTSDATNTAAAVANDANTPVEETSSTSPVEAASTAAESSSSTPVPDAPTAGTPSELDSAAPENEENPLGDEAEEGGEGEEGDTNPLGDDAEEMDPAGEKDAESNPFGDIDEVSEDVSNPLGDVGDLDAVVGAAAGVVGDSNAQMPEADFAAAVEGSGNSLEDAMSTTPTPSVPAPVAADSLDVPLEAAAAAAAASTSEPVPSSSEMPPVPPPPPMEAEQQQQHLSAIPNSEQLQQPSSSELPSSGGNNDEVQLQQLQPPMQEQQQQPESSDDPEDLLTSSTSTSRMEEGDEKFKEIIAEGQMENMFD